MKKSLKNNQYLILTIIVALLLSVLVFRHFIFSDKYYVFMDLGGDTIGNYMPHLWYLINQVQHYSLHLWSFNMGIGTSVFSLSSFFVDVFFPLYLFFGKTTFPYAFAIVAIVKILVTGMLFYSFIKYYSFDNLTNLLLTILYAFNSYLLVWGQHYGFASMFVYFTFVLLAIERYINTNKYILLIFAIACFLANSIYFVFMAVFFYLPYFYFRSASLNKLKTPIKQTVVISGIFFVGLLLSAFSLYPSVVDLLNSPRVASSFSGITFFFPVRVYFGQVATIYTNWIEYMVHPDWTNSYENSKYFISLLFPLILPLFIFDIVKRQNYRLISIVILCLLPLIFPFFYLILYRFVAPIYPKFRFTFIYIPLEVLSIGYVLKSTVITYKRVIFSLIINFIVVLLMAIYVKQLGQHIHYKFFAEILIFLVIYCILLPKNKIFFRLTLIAVVSLELCIVNSNIEYKDRINLTKDYVVHNQGYYDATNQINEELLKIDNGFYRIDKSYMSGSWNDAQFQNYYGFITYNSLNTLSYLNLMDAFNPSGYLYNPLNHSAKNYNILLGFGDNIPLYTLMTQKYFISHDNLAIPFGYSLLFESDGYKVYQNKYSLSPALFYPLQNCISRELFDRLSIPQKTSALYSYYVSDDCSKSSTPVISDLITSNKLSNFDYIINNQIDDLLESKIIRIGTTSNFIKFKTPESYLHFEAVIQTNKPINGSVYVKVSDNQFSEKAVVRYNIIESGIQHVSLNLPFQNIEQLRLDVSNIENNQVVIKNIKINQLDHNNYINKVNLLKSSTLDPKYSRENPNIFTGDFFANESGMVVFYIPFDKNWHAEVNGKDVNLKLVSIGFVGLPINVGYNSYKVYYKNNAFFIGVIISSVVLCLILVSYLIRCFILSNISSRKLIKIDNE